MLEISLSAEKIGSIGGFPITNSLLTTWLVMALLFVLSFITSRNIKMIPGALQQIMEIVIGGLYDFFESVIGHHVKKVFPLIASLFLFIIFANWIGLLPGVGTIGFFEKEHKTTAVTEETSAQEIQKEEAPAPIHETSVAPAHEGTTESLPKETSVAQEEAGTEEKTKFIPLFRGATADLNTTLALAIIAFFGIQYFGFQTLGGHYAKRFFNFSNPIMLFVGLLEIISDLSKVISFAFRLFGNIFAGEVLLSVMAFLMPFLAPTPFLMLELFVGFIQALVFSTLTAVFINVAVSHEE